MAPIATRATILALCGFCCAEVHGQETSANPIYDPATHTYTVHAPHFTKSKAPSDPMEYRDAMNHWDGTGELLLAPTKGLTRNATFGIGATFDNSDATSGDVDTDDQADRRCPAGTMWCRLQDGRLSLSQGAFVRGRQVPRASTAANVPGVVFTSGQCRYHLTLKAKVREQGEWVDAPQMPPPEYKPLVPPGNTIHLKADETFVMEIGPVPQELMPMPETTRIGEHLPPALVNRCPGLSGMVTFEPRGIYFEQPWTSDPQSTPGLRRDPQARATTLIFQSADCREEMTVTREIHRNGVWQLSFITPALSNVDAR